MEFANITTEDSSRYLEYLKVCPQVPADCYNAFALGYDAVWPAKRAYAYDLCWQKAVRDGSEFYYAPMGNWENVDWKAIFEQEIAAGTKFQFVPGKLKDIWVSVLEWRFEVKACRDDWDYLYDMEKFYNDIRIKRRRCKKFKANYEYTVEPITASNLDKVRNLNNEAESFIRSKPEEDYSELDQDDIAMNYLFKYWAELGSLEGLLLKVGDRYVSHLIWDVIDDRICNMFNKNLYEYDGAIDVAIEEMCLCNLAQGRRWINLACDAGIEGIRKSKTVRNPIAMLEKYEVVWIG